MSRDPPTADSSTAGDPWQQVDRLVAEIVEWSRSKPRLPLEEFHRRVVEGVFPITGAVGGACWVAENSNLSDVRCTCQVGNVARQSTGDVQDWRAGMALESLRKHAFLESLPGSRDSSSSALVNDSNCLVVFCPWQAGSQVVGALELWLTPETGPEMRLACRRFLEAVTELIGDDTRDRILDDWQNRERDRNQWNRFTQQIHSSLTTRQVAYRIANEGRLTVECDRLSVTGRRAGGYRLLAASGVDTVDRRATAVRLLEQLSTAIIKTGEPFYYTGTVESLPTQLESALQHYLDESGCRRLAIVPLRLPPDCAIPEYSRSTVPGALIAEWFHAAPTDSHDSWQQQIERTAAQAAIALRNAETIHNLPLSSLLQWVARARWWLQWRQLPWTICLGLLLTALLSAGAFITVDFTIEAKFQLKPTKIQHIFAPADGVIVELAAEYGQSVEKDDVVATLVSPHLDMEHTRIAGQLQTARMRMSAVETARISQRSPADEDEARVNASGEVAQLEQTIHGLEQQLSMLRQRREELQIRSPMAGSVLTWNVETELRGRPVRRGQVLLTVADIDGTWQLEARVPDRDIGHVVTAGDETTAPLTVLYSLATDPAKRFTGQVEQIAMSTENDAKSVPFVVVTVAIDPTHVPARRLGAAGLARIDCGKRRLAYVWFHDLADSVRLWLMAWG